MSTEIEGGCLCGAIRYRASDYCLVLIACDESNIRIGEQGRHATRLW